MKPVLLLGVLLALAHTDCGGDITPAQPVDAAADVSSAATPDVATTDAATTDAATTDAATTDAATTDAATDAPGDACVVFAQQAGCVGSPTLTVANPDYPSTVAETRLCAAETDAATVRLRLCIAPPRPSCHQDDGVAYCAVVDLARDAIPSLAVGAAMRLDGESRFVFTGPTVYRVRPSDVTYVAAAPVSGVQRVWMEKGCYCTPTALGAAQTFTGSLRLDAAPSGRLRGHLTMTLDGIVSPTTYITERVELATGFDVALPPAE